MARQIDIELDMDGCVTLKRTGYPETDPLADVLYIPDFAGAITKDLYLNPLVAREIYDSVVNIVQFVLGQDAPYRTYWTSVEVEFTDGQAAEESARAEEDRSR